MLKRTSRYFFQAFIASVLLLPIAADAQAQRTLSLRQCIDSGLARNFDVERRRIEEQNEQITYRQSQLNLLPDLNGQAGYSAAQGRSIDPFTNSPVTQSFNSSSYSLNSGLVLFNGLSRWNLIRQARLGWQASQLEIQQQKDNLAVNVILAYLQVLSLSEQLGLAREQAGLSAQQVDRLSILNEQGDIRPSDLSDLKGQLSNDQLNIVSTHINLETARLSLFRLINIPYDSTIILQQVTAEDFVERDSLASATVYDAAISHLAVIKAADLRTLSANKGLKVARGGLWPTLSLGANLYTQYSSVATQSRLVNSSFVSSDSYADLNGQHIPIFSKQDNFSQSVIPFGDQLNNNLNTSVGLTLSIPIFNALQQRNKIRLAQLQIRQSRLVAADTRRQLRQDVDQATVNLEGAMDIYKTVLKQVSAYNESFQAAEARFNEGVGTPIDYLTAKNNLDRANRTLVNARYDYVLRSKIVDFYSGKAFW